MIRQQNIFNKLLTLLIILLIFSCSTPGNDNSSNKKDSKSDSNNNPADNSDKTKPEVNIINPVNSGTLNGDTLIKVTATDNKGIKKVEFYAGKTLLVTDTTKPYQFNWKLSPLDNGDQIIKVIATDTAGNIAEDSIKVKINLLEVVIPIPSVFMDIFPVNATITFTSKTAGTVISTGISSNLTATEPDTWIENSSITLSNTGTFKLFARGKKTGLNDSEIFSEIITVSSTFPAAAGNPGSDAVHMDDPAIIAWASGFTNYNVGAECIVDWQTPEKALGKAVGSSYDIVCLGNGGDITLTFPTPIKDGDGADFVIFENSFSDTFLELAYVEVSSNGTDFIRFDCASLTENEVGPFSNVDPQKINGLGGRYKQGYGNPFDLSYLKYREEVLNDTVDLNKITHIRIVDIIGNPASGVTDLDSFGNTIYDPYKCIKSGGFDLDAIGVINQSTTTSKAGGLFRPKRAHGNKKSIFY